MIDTNFEIIQNLEDLASNLQGQVSKLEQEKTAGKSKGRASKMFQGKITALESENLTKMFWTLSSYASKIANDDKKKRYMQDYRNIMCLKSFFIFLMG